MHSLFLPLALAWLGAGHPDLAESRPQEVESAASPKTVRPAPESRTELKRALEALKQVKPRLPLPPLSAEERERYGDRPVVNNGRARSLYLPADWFSGDFRRDPAMTLDYVFKTRIFWIVSRANNCHY